MNKVDIVWAIVTVVFGFISYYLKAKTNIVNKTNELITKAEDTYKDVDKAGIMKKAFVVNELYQYIPVALKPFISKELLGILVDNIFTAVEEYAKIAIDKATAKVDTVINTKIDAAEKQIHDSASKVISTVNETIPTTPIQ